MSLGLVGRKIGMTRVFTDDGDSIPVTVVDVSNNRVTQIKTPEADGYTAVQVAYGKRRARRVNKAARTLPASSASSSISMPTSGRPNRGWASASPASRSTS